MVDNVKLDNKSVKIITVVHQIVVDSKNLDKKFYNNTMKHINIKNSMLCATLKQQEDDSKWIKWTNDFVFRCIAVCKYNT